MNRPPSSLVLAVIMLVATATTWWHRPVPRSRLLEREPALHIDINTADVPSLCLLPVIGPNLAQRVIAFRLAHGAFASINDLDAVAGIGPHTIARLQPWVADVESRGETGTARIRWPGDDAGTRY